MAFQNQNNKQQNESVNSRGFQFFNKDGFEPSTLIVSFWNQMLVLKIHPAKEASKQTETSVYDYDKVINIVIPPIIAKTIAEYMKTKFIPALEKGEDFTVGFPIGGNGNAVLALSTGIKKFGTLKPFVKIIRDVQPGTLVSEDSLSYEFNSNMIINNYLGEGKEGIDFIHFFGEVYYFADIVEKMATAVLGIENHGRKYVDRRFNNSVFELYKAIAASIGHNFYSDSSNGFNRNTVNVWGNYNENKGSEFNNFAPKTQKSEAPVEVGSIEDLESFIN